MKLRPSHLEQISEQARKGYPFEICGALLGRGAVVEEVAPLENREVAAPRVRYLVDPRDLIQLQRRARANGLDIIGYYHSHPDHPARPSETDRKVAAEGLSDGVFHMVFSVEKGERVTPSAWVFRDAKQAFDEEPLEIEPAS
jgi:proteasome lid subunit RPN8/RPN11